MPVSNAPLSNKHRKTTTTQALAAGYLSKKAAGIAFEQGKVLANDFAKKMLQDEEFKAVVAASVSSLGAFSMKAASSFSPGQQKILEEAQKVGGKVDKNWFEKLNKEFSQGDFGGDGKANPFDGNDPDALAKAREAIQNRMNPGNVGPSNPFAPVSSGMVTAICGTVGSPAGSTMQAYAGMMQWLGSKVVFTAGKEAVLGGASVALGSSVMAGALGVSAVVGGAFCMMHNSGCIDGANVINNIANLPNKAANGVRSSIESHIENELMEQIATQMASSETNEMMENGFRNAAMDIMGQIAAGAGGGGGDDGPSLIDQIMDDKMKENFEEAVKKSTQGAMMARNLPGAIKEIGTIWSVKQASDSACRARCQVQDREVEGNGAITSWAKWLTWPPSKRQERCESAAPKLQLADGSTVNCCTWDMHQGCHFNDKELVERAGPQDYNLKLRALVALGVIRKEDIPSLDQYLMNVYKWRFVVPIGSQVEGENTKTAENADGKKSEDEELDALDEFDVGDADTTDGSLFGVWSKDANLKEIKRQLEKYVKPSSSKVVSKDGVVEKKAKTAANEPKVLVTRRSNSVASFDKMMTQARMNEIDREQGAQEDVFICKNADACLSWLQLSPQEQQTQKGREFCIWYDPLSVSWKYLPSAKNSKKTDWSMFES